MRFAAACLFAAWSALAGGAAFAQAEPPVELSGTLLKARTSGAVVIAYRESSIPFSYLSARGEPIGYSIELCRRLVDAIGEAVGRELEIKWLPVTPESRIEAIVSGKADLECGSTTNNLERQKLVSFSPTLFVSGTKLLVRNGSPVRSFRDLAGRKVAVTAGTTNEKTLRELAAKFRIDMTLQVAPDHAASFALLASGAVDAFATDDVLLYGLLAQHRAQGEYTVIGDFLSYDPYGLMFRKGDAPLAALIDATFRMIAEDGEIERRYKRWFLQKLPTGESLNLPMSPQLEGIVQMLGSPAR